MNEFQPTNQKDTKKLKQYCSKVDGYIDMEKYGLYVHNLLKDMPFFKRFDKKTLLKYLAFAQPKYYKANEIVFVNEQVGIITSGSLRIKSHCIDGMLNPVTIAKLSVGKIIGHESDNRVSTSSQTWIISFDEGTEILFFDKQAFNKLWEEQNKQPDAKFIEQFLLMNPLMQCLSEQSMKQIVHEDLIIKRFRPGQSICRMTKRSEINKLFNYINYNGKSKFKEDTSKMVMDQHIEEIKASEFPNNEPRTGTTALTGFMKQFTAEKKPIPPPVAAAAEEEVVKEKPQAEEQNRQDTQESASKEPEQKKKQQENLDELELKYEESVYMQCDGFYIVYKGQVDIVNPLDR